jgi:hypothetical protein
MDLHASSSRVVASVGFLTLAFLGVCPAYAAKRQKTDVIYMKNGDRITCEIKKLEYGQLEVSAPYGKGSFILNWEEIEKIDSSQLFVVEAQSGTYFQGPIHADAKQDDNLEVQTAKAVVSLPQREVIRVRQYGRATLDRLAFAVDYGFTYARSNQQTQSTLHSNIEYRSERVLTGGAIDSLFASRSDASDTNRHESSAYYYRRIQASRWYGGWFGNFLTNNQQDLALRISGGAGVLRDVFTTHRNSLLARAGVVYSRERFTVPAPDGADYNSAEGAFGVRYTTFRFDSTQFVTNLTVYPSLTQAGRVRSAADLSLYLKVIGDFYTRFGFYSNFDSRPPSDTSKHDYGLSTSLGWSF